MSGGRGSRSPSSAEAKATLSFLARIDAALPASMPERHRAAVKACLPRIIAEEVERAEVSRRSMVMAKMAADRLFDLREQLEASLAREAAFRKAIRTFSSASRAADTALARKTNALPHFRRATRALDRMLALARQKVKVTQ